MTETLNQKMRRAFSVIGEPLTVVQADNDAGECFYVESGGWEGHGRSIGRAVDDLIRKAEAT